MSKSELQTLANIWLERAEELAQEHFSNDREEWDDDEAYGKYIAFIECRNELLRLPEKDKKGA
jgi:hypothetical protein